MINYQKLIDRHMKIGNHESAEILKKAYSDKLGYETGLWKYKWEGATDVSAWVGVSHNIPLENYQLITDDGDIMYVEPEFTYIKS